MSDYSANASSNEDVGEIVVRLSQEIDSISPASTADAIETEDEILRDLIIELSSTNNGASQAVIRDVDIFLADDTFHGTIYDNSGDQPASRMSRNVVSAIIRGADIALADRRTGSTSDALSRFYDELDAKLPNTDEALQEVLTGAGSSPESVMRDAGDELARAVKSLEYGTLGPSHDRQENNVIVAKFGRLVEQTKISAQVTYDAIAEAAEHARSLFSENSPSISAAAGGTGNAGSPDWDDFLAQIRGELGIEDTPSPQG